VTKKRGCVVLRESYCLKLTSVESEAAKAAESVAVGTTAAEATGIGTRIGTTAAPKGSRSRSRTSGTTGICIGIRIGRLAILGGGGGAAGGRVGHVSIGTLLAARLGIRRGGGVSLAIVALVDALAIGITGGVLAVAILHHL